MNIPCPRCTKAEGHLHYVVNDEGACDGDVLIMRGECPDCGTKVSVRLPVKVQEPLV